MSRPGTLPAYNGLLLSGFYPRIYDVEINPTQARGDYVRTHVERDIRQLVTIKDLAVNVTEMMAGIEM